MDRGRNKNCSRTKNIKYTLAGDQPPENHPGGRQDGRITWVRVGGGRIALKAEAWEVGSCAWVSVGEAQTWCGQRGHSFFVVEDAVALAVSDWKIACLGR